MAGFIRTMARRVHRILNGPAPAIPIGTVPGNLKAYALKETDDDSVEIEMYGEVVEKQPIDWWGEPVPGLYIALDSFLKDLDKCKTKKNVTVRINSVGGDLYAGITICNRLSQLPGNVTTIVDGLAASAASIILQGGKTRLVFPGSQVMIHGASSFLYGSYNLSDLDKVVNMLKGGNRSALETYASRCGLSKAVIKNMMDKESWLTGQDAIDNGFADGFVDTEDKVQLSMSADMKTIYSNGVPMSAVGFKCLPGDIPVMTVSDAQPVVNAVHKETLPDNTVITGFIPEPDVTNKKQPGGKGKMTLEELMKSDPELVSQIQNAAIDSVQGESQTQVEDAVKAERARLQKIAEIENSIGDKKLIDEAKFGEKPMTAEELAFAAMKQQAVVGAQFLANMKEDAKTSGAEGVEATPTGTVTPEDQEADDIKNGAALIAGLTAQAQEGVK